MLRRALIFCLLAGVFAPPAGAAQQLLMPGVTYERKLQFTRFGPQSMHILTAPKPVGGLYGLKPVLSNGAAVGRERVTSMQKRAEASATVAGVNGDLFTWADGIPSSGLIQDGVLRTTPHPKRSMLGVDTVGNLRVDRVAMIGTWQGSGPRRPIHLINRPPGPNGTTLYTPSYGATTPTEGGVFEAVLSPFPSATPNAELVGFVSENRRGGTPIPPGGAVLVARGTQAQRMAVEAATAEMVTIRLVLRPEWRDVPEALGGGPELIRQGKPDLPAERGLRDLPPQSPPPAHGCGSEGGRPHRDARRGRPAPGLLGGDDELRARADDDAPRRRDGVGARCRRLFHDGVRRAAPEPAVRLRRRASRLRGAARHVLRRLRARHRALVLAERRRSRRPAADRVQDRQAVDGDGDADRSRRHPADDRLRRAQARQLQVLVRGAAEPAERSSGRARRQVPLDDHAQPTPRAGAPRRSGCSASTTRSGSSASSRPA